MIDSLLEKALAAGGHLADDVAAVILEEVVKDEEVEGDSPSAGS